MSIVSRVQDIGDDNYELGGHWDESVNGLNDDAATDHTSPQNKNLKFELRRKNYTAHLGRAPYLRVLFCSLASCPICKECGFDLGRPPQWVHGL